MVRPVYHGGFCLCITTIVAAISLLAPLPASAQDGAGAVSEPDIAALSAIVADAATGEVLYDHNAELRLPPASLTKLFTALVALESAPLDRRMSVSEDDLVGEASMGLVAGENLALETLLYGLLLPSGNDAAMTIARNLGNGSSQAFLDQTNARLAELGLADTALINPHGLDAHLHYSSARDLAAVTLFLLRTQPDFTRISGALDHVADGHELYQTNDLHVTYPGLIAGKTGVTDDAGFCLMEVAERDGRQVVTVLLGSTSDAWYADAELLLDYGFATLAVPGRLPATDVISLGQPAPAQSTVPETAVQQPAATAPANATSLQVVPVGQGTSLVNEPSIAEATRRSPWLWLTLPLVAVPAILFALLQVSQLGARRTARRVRPEPAAPVTHAHPRAEAWETAPFATVAPHQMAMSGAEDDADLHLIWDRATRERLLRGRAALNVSIGD